MVPPDFKPPTFFLSASDPRSADPTTVEVPAFTPEEEAVLANEMDYPRMLNSVLPDDIRVLSWSPVALDFRYSSHPKVTTPHDYFPAEPTRAPQENIHGGWFLLSDQGCIL